MQHSRSTGKSGDPYGVAEMAEPIITIAAAARSTGVPYASLLRLIHLRRIPCVRVAGTRRVRLSQVQSCIEELGAA
jgi:excisionase family DNA binding protein